MRPKNHDIAARIPAGSQGPDSEAYRQVLEALRELRPDGPDVALKMKDTPMRELGSRILEEAVRTGDAEKALRYLQIISGGQNG